MKNTYKQTEKGQIALLLALAMVVLLGFTALAVDVGMIFADRRYDQSVSDSAALAGGAFAAQALENLPIHYNNFSCTDAGVLTTLQNAQDAAQQRALTNDFTLEDNLDNQHGVVVDCNIDDLISYEDKYLDISVMVSSEVETGFAHLLYDGPYRNTVETVARVHPRTSLAYGYAIATLDETCNASCDDVDLIGNSTITLNNSGIFSNSCLKAAGNVTVTAAQGIHYVDTYCESGNPNVSPAPVQDPITIPRVTVPPPDCTLVPDQGSSTSGGTINPGRYSLIKMASGSLTMNPGLYCLSGNFTITGGTTQGTNITIYITSGDFSGKGSAEINLSAPTVESPPAMKGMLIFLADGNTGTVTVSGSSTSTFTGTVYAPDGTVIIGGNSSLIPTYNTQIVANEMKVSGSVDMEINFEGANHYQMPAFLDLYK